MFYTPGEDDGRGEAVTFFDQHFKLKPRTEPILHGANVYGQDLRDRLKFLPDREFQLLEVLDRQSNCLVSISSELQMLKTGEGKGDLGTVRIVPSFSVLGGKGSSGRSIDERTFSGVFEKPVVSESFTELQYLAPEILPSVPFILPESSPLYPVLNFKVQVGVLDIDVGTFCSQVIEPLLIEIEEERRLECHRHRDRRNKQRKRAIKGPKV